MKILKCPPTFNYPDFYKSWLRLLSPDFEKSGPWLFFHKTLGPINLCCIVSQFYEVEWGNSFFREPTCKGSQIVRTNSVFLIYMIVFIAHYCLIYCWFYENLVRKCICNERKTVSVEMHKCYHYCPCCMRYFCFKFTKASITFLILNILKNRKKSMIYITTCSIKLANGSNCRQRDSTEKME